MQSFITERDLARELAANPDFWPWATILASELDFTGPDPSEDAPDGLESILDDGEAS